MYRYNQTQYGKKIRDKFTVEDHQFETYVPPEARMLIIGTFPTHEGNFRYKYYYSGEENHFWSIIEKVFNHTFGHHSGPEAVQERKDFLEQHRIGITDMIEKCYRKNNLSGDENIFPIVLRDIFSIIEANKTITRLILTSRTEVFGVLGLLTTYFYQKGQQPIKTMKRKDKILEGDFEWAGRSIKVLVPYSPSPRVINDGGTTIEELEQMYRVCLAG